MQNCTTSWRVSESRNRNLNDLLGRGLWWLLIALAFSLVPCSSSLAADEFDLSGVIVERSGGELKRFRWDFGRRNDPDFKRWPEGWKRLQGPGYPRYVPIGIVAHDADVEDRIRKLDIELVRIHRWLSDRWPSLQLPLPPALSDLFIDRYLRIDLDGGLAIVQSPPVETSWLYQYRLRCRIMTTGLRYDRVRAELVFIDTRSQAAGSSREPRELSSHSTPVISGTTPWTELVVDRLRPPPEATGMMVRLVVEGSDDGLEDIRGVIGLDEVVIEKFPQLSLTTDEPLGIYHVHRRPVAKAKVMGLPSNDASLRFSLSDWDGIELASRSLPIQAGQRDGEVAWPLPPLGPGLYRVTVRLAEEEQRDLGAETTLAVIDELISGPAHGVFGWTLPDGLSGPDGLHPIESREIGRWLADLGVAWVKFPCWVAPHDDAAAEQVATVLTRLQDFGIQTIGMLDEPPASELQSYDVRGRRIPFIAELLRDLETWQPLLEPVMTRITLKVKQWQLGADRDHSFLGRPRLNDSIREIAQGLQGFGQPIDVAISWPWLEPLPGDEPASWRAVCRSSDPELNAEELDAYLGQASSDSPGTKTWLLLSPISAQRYDRDQRVRDLVMRMAAVRKHPVQAAFVSDPRDPEYGLLREDGRPDEMLLPWRTTARLIGNLHHSGSLKLRSNAENAVFRNASRAVLMVWAAEPTDELIYLGPSARHVDALGRDLELPVEPYGGHEVHRVSIGTTPSFLIDVDPDLLAFRMSIELEQKQLDSLLGTPQRLSIRFRNPTRDTLAGEVRIDPPETWSVRSDSPDWDLFRGREAEHPFEVVLSNSASVGEYELPIRFMLQTVPPKQITVYRTIHVGPEGLDIEVQTRLTDNGDLELRLQMTNRTDQRQAYDCLLFPGQGRHYDRRIVSLEAAETEVRLFRWPNGKDLLGKTVLLRASEQDGQRILNYPIVVKP